MQWYQGPIEEAIASAKSTSKIFLVFVDGKDETSQKMSVLYDNAAVQELIRANCVAITLTTESEQFKNFSQIYPVIVVPSSFFIGNDGIPIEVIGGNISVEEFVKKVTSTVELHVQKSGAVKNSDPGGSASNAASESNEDFKVDSSISLEEKVERAKRLVEERKQQKMREEQEASRIKELEHRRMGKEIQSAREKQQAKEILEWAEQRKKEKDADKAAREKVKAQIAQDRADRAARFGSQSPAKPDAAKAPEIQSTPPEVRQRASASDRTRIQFRLPNAVTRTQEFASNARLEEVFQFIDQSIKPNFQNYSLATTFSRRQLTHSDDNLTLTELELVPSAVLLIIPTGSTSSNISSSLNVLPLLYAIFSPLLFLWNTLLSFFRSSPTPPPTSLPLASGSQRTSSSGATSRGSPSGGRTLGGDGNDSTSSSGSGGANSPKASRLTGAQSKVYKKDGNIHRLANSDDDEENNTWNGNSTQQL